MNFLGGYGKIKVVKNGVAEMNYPVMLLPRFG